MPTPIKPIPGHDSFSNLSFRPNPRKMSEDNVLSTMKLSQLRRPEDSTFSDLDFITKKFKV